MVAARLALTHRIGRFLGHYLDGNFIGPRSELPEGTASVRVRRYRELGQGIDSEQLTIKIAANYVSDRKVDLAAPQVEIRGLISDRLLVHHKLIEIDRSQYDLRKVKERPFFSPISLHPRYARAVVNMTGAKAGDRVLDPFCGTGGLLIEAAMLGMKVYGSDLSPEMIEGCAQNLEHFGLKADRLEAIDVGKAAEVFGEVDGVASDPPYGRSTSTNREALDSLYSRSLVVMAQTVRADGRLCMVFPRDVVIPENLVLEERHDQRVHRSLSRYYMVLRRR
ncbi:MAG: tRNA (guanine(10)-N2)-dimethyltransferase [Methanomassiliicoccales archaeon PtaU1.Bin124]|nr:MAG: tRNA (guanine(10)-N2)-dimethyltransferase [Methanomassiliicoccales archaeon PtaU1.Bin124]